MTTSILLRLLEQRSSLSILAHPAEDLGIADTLPFPFIALVGQKEMKIALLLSLINPRIGGLLLIGPRGTGKTTAVRSLTDLLPMVPRSLCPYGCTEQAVEEGGIDAICPDCAVRYGHGDPLTALDRVRLIELPLNSRLEDVVGGINERIAVEQQRVRLERGILAHADNNILYVDEVNLLGDVIVNAILDAAAQGRYTVRRGPLRLVYRSRFTLIGSMNPEEGHLRPQIMDRFGLRVVVNPVEDDQERMDIYQRARAYLENPHAMTAQWFEETHQMAAEIERARNLLDKVELDQETVKMGLELVKKLKIQSHRAEFTLFEASRAHAAADDRVIATMDDLATVATMSLRLRRSPFMEHFIKEQAKKDQEIYNVLETYEDINLS
jgi:magnesium chelatase subunit I